MATRNNENNNTNQIASIDNQEGNFSAVPHEMTEFLMRLDLTSREFKLVFFFIREIQGYQLREKIIKTSKIITSTGLAKQNLNPALKSLITKGVISREPIKSKERGLYLYRFNEQSFGRTCATKEVKQSYFEDGKVIHIAHFRSSNQLLRGNRVNDLKVIDPVTSKTEGSAPSAASQGMKEILNKDKHILREQEAESFTLLEEQEKKEAREAKEKIKSIVEALETEIKQHVEVL